MNICNSVTKYKLKLLFAFLLLLFLDKQLIASPQVPDYIIYNGDTIPTYNLILEKYLQKKNPNSDKLFGLSFGNLLPLEDEDFNMGITVNCWRGYQAIYKIDNDSLFLSNIIECQSIRKLDKELSNKNLFALFGNHVKNDRVFIDWYSGEISFPQKVQNEIIRWDGVFENIFLFETLIKIDNGRIKSIKAIQNYIDAPNRINRKQNDTISNVLFERIKNHKWKKTDKFFCSERYIVRINKKGKVDNIEIDLPKEERKEFDLFEKREYRYCTSSMKKALRGLKFDIINRRGKAIEEYVYIEIWLEDDGSIENWTH